MLIRPHSTDSGVAIDLTPVIDMVFLLLIFFLVATTFQQTEREMKIALPMASAAAPISASLREFIINVDAEGGIFVAGRRIEPEALRSMINDAVKANPQQKVTVRGDRRASYESIVRVLDICKSSGVQEPYLDTVMVN
jgi:biopolymer transport protein ExbD